jgi:SSS family solute:Na+ symporter
MNMILAEAGFGILDISVFVVFVVAVIGLALWQSRTKGKGEKNTKDFFLAGRGLSWWLIGFSLIAANISTEQFVGMSGASASHVGMAIASYEWMAAITLVVVAFAFLPYFLRVGIYTMPEFLEYRYNSGARLIMASATVLIYMLLLGAVTYSGALTMQTLFGKYGYDINLLTGSLGIAFIAMVYVVTGGLKASVWADLIQGSALIIGGAIVMFFAFDKLGSVEQAATVVDAATGEVGVIDLEAGTGSMERFLDLNSNRLNMFLPASDRVLPWTALLLGLWIPNFYYWGLNQYITQRTLGSASLSQGQKGIVFAAFLKLLIPFVVVIPGIIAFNVYYGDMQLDARGDSGKAMAMYLKANPDTKYVQKADAPDAGTVEAHEGPVYLLAVYPDEESMDKIKKKNPFVLPMTKKTYDGYEPGSYQVFSAKEDRAWRHVNPELATEITAYNKAVTAKAETDGKDTESQALVAYKYDTALGHLLGMLPVGKGIIGFVLAALLGAVVSSLAAMLNAASTIFTMDIFKKYMRPKASEHNTVLLGRIAVVAFAVIAFLLAPQLANPNISNSIFTIIQESQGFISPGILAVFAIGLLLRRCPRSAGVAGLLTSIVAYGVLKFAAPSIQFLNRMAICFGLCIVVMVVMNMIRPLKERIVFEGQGEMDLKSSRGALIAGIVCVIVTLILYVIFSPLVIAK